MANNPMWEGEIRERAAAYLLSAPALFCQTTQQKKQTVRVLEELWRVEVKSAQESAGIDRRLFFGDMTGFLKAILCSAGRLLCGTPSALTLVTPVTETPCLTALEPRLLQLGVVALLRDSAQRGKSTAVLEVRPRYVKLTFRRTAVWLRRSEAVQLAKETARLHRGRLAVRKNEICLWLSTRGKALEPLPPFSVARLAEELTSLPVIGLLSFRKDW